jgi:hypothetical protein
MARRSGERCSRQPQEDRRGEEVIIDKFPGIKKVALEIAYDNGFIHRDCTEEAWLESLDPVLGATGVDETD